MGRIQNFGQQSYAQLRPTFVGTPIEAIKETNQVLDARYHQNKAAYENQVDFLANVSVETQNQGIVDSQKAATEEQFQNIIATNNFEFSDQTVTGAAREIKNNKELKGSIQSKMQRDAYMASVDEMVKDGKLDQMTANRIKGYSANSNYKTITVDENGVINNIFAGTTAVEDPDINTQLEELADKLEADKTVIGLSDGTSMVRMGGQWVGTRTHETINNDRANQALMQMMVADPKNKAWFNQQKMLDDVDTIVKNEDGTFKTDENGNVEYDYTQVDYFNKLSTIGLDDEELGVLISQYNAQMSGYGDGLDFDAMSMEEQQDFAKVLYDSNYMTGKLRPVVNAAVNVVDYDRFEQKLYQDQWYLFKAKEAYKKKIKEEERRNMPSIKVDMIDANNSLPSNAGEMVQFKQGANIAYDGSVNTANKLMNTSGVKGEFVLMPDGSHKIKRVVDGRETFIDIDNADVNGTARAIYDENVKQAYNSKTQIDNEFAKRIGTLPQGTKEELEQEMYNFSGGQLQDLVDSLSKADKEKLVKLGVISDGSGIAPLGFQILPGHQVIHASSKGMFGEGKPNINRIAAAVKEGILPSSHGYMSNKTADAIKSLSNADLDRLNIALADQRNTTINTEHTARLLDNKDVFYKTAKAQGIIDINKFVDAEAHNISYNEKDALVTSSDLNSLLNTSKDLQIAYDFSGDTPKMIYTGTITDEDGNNPKSITAIREEPDPAYATHLLYEDEQRISFVSSMLSSDFKNNGGEYKKTYNFAMNDDGSVDPNGSITVERVALGADGKRTRKESPLNTWAFSVTTADGQVRPELNLANSKQTVYKFLNWVAPLEADKSTKKFTPKNTKTY